jgi:diguanylate cyclase (GGDEF)-like protein
VAVLFIDLDGLKGVNDTYGHAAGDALIRCFAEHLQASVRPNDPIARVGGDEFIVLLEDLHEAAEAETVARRVIESLRVCQTAAGLPAPPTASVGIAVADRGDVGADTLISQADAAMYRAKHAGGNRYEVFDELSYAPEAGRRRLRAELADALGRGQLRLHHQPIVDLATGDIHGVEALLRWQHPTRGLITAGEFIDLAEDTGLILDLGRWVILEVCRQLAEWQDSLAERAPSRIFLNLSVAELTQSGLSEFLAGTAAEAGVDPKRLVVEVTETGMLQEPDGLARAVSPLLALGCQVAIDDFGTGHSSLTRLVQLPASILKIDASFVQELTSGGTAEAIVRTVLQLANTLDLTVVAEGVEDAATLTALQHLGCTYAQGYHLGHPGPARQVTRLLAAQSGSPEPDR